MTRGLRWRALLTAFDAVDAHPIDAELASLLLAVEDRRFWRHRGVDLRSVARASWGLLRRRPSGGGSTVDMQLVRTLTGRYDRTVYRKLTEMHFALRLRRRVGAERILAVYAAVAYCGEGIIGLCAAADHLFCKPIGTCSTIEKAALAAVLLHPIPTSTNPRWRDRLDRRAARAVAVVRSGQPAARFSLAAP